MFLELSGGARFEATIFKEHLEWRVSEQFSRINLYGDQSICVEDATLKLVCFCK